MVLTIKRQNEKPAFAKALADAVDPTGRSSNLLVDDLKLVNNFNTSLFRMLIEHPL
jgi:hypothetical protein